MNTNLKLNTEGQRGFTLVELAIVMIIIGLLIGGVLKGQELISNAEVSASAAQVKATEAGMSTFQDAYGGIPGDINNPGARIPNCAGICAATDAAPINVANGRIEQVPGAAQTIAPGQESTTYWAQLAASDIIGGVVPNATALQGTVSHPEFPAGGALRVGFHPGGAVVGDGTMATNTPAGTYLNTTIDLGNVAGTAGDFALTPSQAFRIDSKIDDGRPNTGTVLGGGGNAGAAGDCALLATAPADYNTSQTSLNCNVYMRIR